VGAGIPSISSPGTILEGKIEEIWKEWDGQKEEERRRTNALATEKRAGCLCLSLLFPRQDGRNNILLP
jgi:hypothetical protein